jgi:hypothetical protein
MSGRPDGAAIAGNRPKRAQARFYGVGCYVDPSRGFRALLRALRRTVPGPAHTASAPPPCPTWAQSTRGRVPAHCPGVAGGSESCLTTICD